MNFFSIPGSSGQVTPMLLKNGGAPVTPPETRPEDIGTQKLEFMLLSLAWNFLGGKFQTGAQGHSLQLVHNRLELCRFVAFWALL